MRFFYWKVIRIGRIPRGRRCPKQSPVLLCVLVLILVGYLISDAAWAGRDRTEKSSMNKSGASRPQKEASASSYRGSKYVVIGWNDLGMHCINPSFSELALLPPFNNLWVQVILKGDPPKIVTSGISLEYSILNNTTVVGKTDFWQYVNQPFGVSLPVGIGLTGNGLSGKMQLAGDHFEATGIPVLPYDDRMNWNPFQTAIVTLKNGKGAALKKTEVILPVSDEINCAQCHMQGMDGTTNLPGGGDQWTLIRTS